LNTDVYRPPRWLRNSHLQLAWGLLRARPRLELRREIVETADGDVVALDHVDTGPAPRPRLLVLHGLEGSSFSPTSHGLLALASRRGWNGTALNFRSCARDLRRPGRRIDNRTVRLYHSGETGDLDAVIALLTNRERGAPLLAAGGSIGGNVLLKWLGENPGTTRITAAAAVSTPYDLLACARHLESGLGPLYTAFFLRSLRAKAISHARRFPEAARRLDLRRTKRARTFFEFDDAATAPLHGFSGASDYYARSSSLPYLSSITTPTLCLSAADDPFLPAPVAREAGQRASAAVDFRVTASGSHLGFPEGSPFHLRSWAEETVVSWLAARIG
jgi:predicted alpha/beta-fold hydrolase